MKVCMICLLTYVVFLYDNAGASNYFPAIGFTRDKVQLLELREFLLQFIPYLFNFYLNFWGR